MRKSSRYVSSIPYKTENETELTAAIEALTKEKTIIMIAHRLKTVRHADQIFVIDNGHIAQKGTYDDLMKEVWPQSRPSRSAVQQALTANRKYAKSPEIQRFRASPIYDNLAL